MSKIAWTNKTWNPTTGCSKVSQGCKNCYAERQHKRLTAMGLSKYSKPFSEVVCHPQTLNEPAKWKKPRMVFVNSMSDLFHEDVPEEFIDQVFESMFENEQHIYQILTKQPAWMGQYLQSYDIHMLENIWFGTSVEDDKQFQRIDDLMAWVRNFGGNTFLSLEPLLGPVGGIPRVGWVIAGAESGPKRRPCNLMWVDSIVRQCREQNIPVFVKQIPLPSGKITTNINHFPNNLRFQEFPQAMIERLK